MIKKQDPPIKVKVDTKNKLDNLGFPKGATYDDIIRKLIEVYEQNKKNVKQKPKA